MNCPECQKADHVYSKKNTEYYCSRCLRDFTGERIESRNINPSATENIPLSYTCEICGESYQYKGWLHRHKRDRNHYTKGQRSKITKVRNRERRVGENNA